MADDDRHLSALFELDAATNERLLAECGRALAIGPEELVAAVTYDEYLADFRAGLHDLRGARGFKACLDATSDIASQALASALLEAGSLGTVYPSVRRTGGTCLACFRPALVTLCARAPVGASPGRRAAVPR